MEKALEQAGISFQEMSYVVATGYGRMAVPFADRQITELACKTGEGQYDQEIRKIKRPLIRDARFWVKSSLPENSSDVIYSCKV
jgi:hypothetical protein